jgi:hypothetical protein
VAARRLLGGHPVVRLAGSDDPGLDIVLRHTGASVITVGTRSLTGESGLVSDHRR